MDRLDKHEWTDEQGHQMRAENGSLWAVTRHTDGKYREVDSIVGDIAAREIQRLAALDREREGFIGELIGALGLSRKVIELSPTPITNVLLEIIRGLAGNRSALCRKCGHPRYEHQEGGCDFCTEIATSRPCFAFEPIVKE